MRERLHPVGIMFVGDASRSSNGRPAAWATARHSSLLNSRFATRHASAPVSSTPMGTSGGAGGGDRGGGDGLTATSHTRLNNALAPTLDP